MIGSDLKNAVVVSAAEVASSCGPNLADLAGAIWKERDTRILIPDSRRLGRTDMYRTGMACCIDLGDSRDTVTDINSELLVDLGVEYVGRALALCAPRDPRRTGLVVATTTGGSFSYLKYKTDTIRGLSGIEHLRMPISSGVIAAEIADAFQLGGLTSVVSTACSAGTDGIGRALVELQAGYVSRVIVLGLDLFSHLALAGFNALQALSSDIARPFDEARDGLVLGDAIAVLVLDSTHEVADSSIAEVKGYATGNEAFHATAPDPSGTTLQRVMSECLADAGLGPADLDYINAHGTATAANDPAELAAIGNMTQGADAGPIPVSSTKHLTGHCLGAAGVVEAAVCVLAIRDQLVPGNHFTTQPITTPSSVSLPTATVSGRVKHAMSINLAFSGNVAAVVLSEVA